MDYTPTRTLYAEIDNTYWKEFKKMCVDKGISLKKFIEIMIYKETDNYINQQNFLEKEPEKENDI
jgi:hypothetical protein